MPLTIYRLLGNAVIQSRRARGKASNLESIKAATSGDLSLIAEDDVADLLSRLERAGSQLGLALDPAQGTHRALLDAGRHALQSVAKDPRAALTILERSALEAIVMAIGRPSILIRNGQLSTIADEWEQLALGFHVDAIASATPSVGRVEVTGHPDGLTWVGTAWMAAEQIAMTNRHVVEEFAHQVRGRWTVRDGMTAAVDFMREDDSVAGPQFTIDEIVGVHEDPDIDLALIRLSAVASDRTPLPRPLVLESAPDAVRTEWRVYTLGYPGEDRRHGEVEDELFGGIYGSKRLAPGQIAKLAQDSYNLLHDCSTLKGSSGSCVIAFENHRVVALHYSGSPFLENHAVWLAAVKDDPLVRAAGLNYQ